MDLETVGVAGLSNLGLGDLGQGMAAALARRGFSVLGYDIGDARCQAVEAAFDYARAGPLLAAPSARPPHVGPSGAGNIVKLVDDLLVAAHLVTTGEAMRLSGAAGPSAEEATAVVDTATGRSAISEVMAPRRILSNAFDGGFPAGGPAPSGSTATRPSTSPPPSAASAAPRGARR